MYSATLPYRIGIFRILPKVNCSLVTCLLTYGIYQSTWVVIDMRGRLRQQTDKLFVSRANTGVRLTAGRPAWAENWNAVADDELASDLGAFLHGRSAGQPAARPSPVPAATERPTVKPSVVVKRIVSGGPTRMRTVVAVGPTTVHRH